MRPQSAKAKGRNAQKEVRDELLSRAPTNITDKDIRSTSMGVTGVDIQLSGEAERVFPYAIEVKCQESLNIWSALEQAEQNREANLTPILCFKRNRSEMYVAMKFQDFLNLMDEAKI